ncbi:TetR-like C-terminal domain-containing protein [Streptomyces sp. NPDC050422]|uniref:TetR-like C-terminal domain-containing protein n=1 Tax=Streptomyces sp. NPDC050422 TaxID=3365614 RepID=UPI0037985800
MFPTPAHCAVDLVALTEQVIGLVTGVRTQPVVRAVTSGSGLPDDELAALTRDFFADRFSREQPVFARAAARGELPPGVDPMLLLDLIAGAVWMRALLRNEPVPPGFAAAAVDAVLPARSGSRAGRQPPLSSSSAPTGSESGAALGHHSSSPASDS